LATRLRGSLPQGVGVVHVDGDRFGIVLEEIDDMAALTETTSALLEKMAEPLLVGQQEVCVTASLGISMAPRDGEDAEALFKHADIAMHHAKKSGRNGFRFYTDDMSACASKRLGLLNELRHALERDQFRVRYQPQVELRKGDVVGAEALLRWEHPRLGLLPPADFIPLLEETGLIVQVGEWVMRQVCMDIVALKRSGLLSPRIAVNLSPRQFHQHDLAARIRNILQDLHLSGGSVAVEVTESLIMQDPAGAVQMLQRLKDIDVHVSVDDFGTGYSSLSYLKTFPIDALKIDKSFVAGVADSPVDAAITEAVIQMGHAIGVRVIAEGVETRQQLAFLKAHACDEVQGYLVGKPTDFGGFCSFLRMRDLCGDILPLPSQKATIAG
jgi:EAL domain-containing protein (putative c-di-GMP-specific phosphodiesterase class I)